MESFSSGSSKKGRAQNSGVSCLVDGCKSDLSNCRDYHRRHKVCEMHSKSPKVTIGGHEQRFCQQCSRFHSLGEFDEGKRSCRKRLEGHNRRRRKPQTQTVNDGNFLTGNNSYLAFSKQAMSTSSSWSGGVKTESSSSPVFNSSCYSQASSSAGHALHHHPTSLPSNCGTNRIINSNNGLINQVTDSNHHHHRALSLLSSSQTPEMGLGQIIQANPINPARPSISGMFYNHSIDHFPRNGGNTGSVLMSSLSQDVIQSGSHGSTATAAATSTSAHQTLSFSWE